MTDYFYTIDLFLFRFLNGTIGNPLFDLAMPLITDINRVWWGWLLIGGSWIVLIWKGGWKGRTAALLLIPTIVLSDQVSSTFIKNLVMRPRPCHTVDGMPVVEQIRLLVHCGGGYSFPSSHAVNNFAAATLFSYFYPRRKLVLLSAAGVMAFSRISVGVHYPSDVIGGMCVGVILALFVLLGWNLLLSSYPKLDFQGRPRRDRRSDRRE